ncbi:MAG TPA: ferritin-like fold-containing protein [Actinomycetota bacterium]|nr:ferritin-like fold-containing protein [Actinomycetota bacterium]
MADTRQQATIDLLGVLAYGELQAFERLSQDALLAPDLAGREAVTEMAIGEYGHYKILAEGLRARGADPAAAMRPFADPIDNYHRSTSPSDYPEALVKIYVGDGIGADFYREVGEFVDESTRELVDEVCADLGHSSFVVPTVREMISRDARLASRLSLWGRRLVGEALSQSQRVAAEREAMGELLVGSTDLAELGRMFARLTDAHAARMRELGLNA